MIQIPIKPLFLKRNTMLIWSVVNWTDPHLPAALPGFPWQHKTSMARYQQWCFPQPRMVDEGNLCSFHRQGTNKPSAQWAECQVVPGIHNPKPNFSKGHEAQTLCLLPGRPWRECSRPRPGPQSVLPAHRSSAAWSDSSEAVHGRLHTQHGWEQATKVSLSLS